jgi:hypothetical protein
MSADDQERNFVKGMIRRLELIQAKMQKQDEAQEPVDAELITFLKSALVNQYGWQAYKTWTEARANDAS